MTRQHPRTANERALALREQERGLARRDEGATVIMESVLSKGDLSALSAAERVDYYLAICRSMDLNPFTKPIEFHKIKGVTVAYLTAGGAAQLRSKHHLNVDTSDPEIKGEYVYVRATATMADGRTDSDMAQLYVKGLSGQDLADAVMKCVTKAKRRITLSSLGLGGVVDPDTGRINQDALTGAADPAMLQEAVQIQEEDLDPADGDRVPPEVDPETGEIVEDTESVSLTDSDSPSPEPADPSSAPTCRRCYQPITAYRDWTASQIVDMTIRVYEHAVCGPCAAEMKAQKEKGKR